MLLGPWMVVIAQPAHSVQKKKVEGLLGLCALVGLGPAVYGAL